MDLFAADDSEARNPRRSGVRRLKALGGVYVPSESVSSLETVLNDHCRDYGFPEGEEFKWSPSRNHWMRTHLLDQERSRFFIEALDLADELGTSVIAVVVDTHARSATGARPAAHDAANMLIERVNTFAAENRRTCLMIMDRAGGGRREEESLVAHCTETLRDGTDYVLPDRFAMGPFTADSSRIRLLQLADLVISCVTAHIAGSGFTDAVFERLVSMFRQDDGRIGGKGLKIHPDLRYVNLYHWLLDDTHWWRGTMGIPLPQDDRPSAVGRLVGN